MYASSLPNSGVIQRSEEGAAEVDAGEAPALEIELTLALATRGAGSVERMSAGGCGTEDGGCDAGVLNPQKHLLLVGRNAGAHI